MKSLESLLSILMLLGSTHTYKTDYVVGSKELSTSKSLTRNMK
ncbi:hypothetical protein [Thalassotalea eurytherma]|uniref:Uncharacterized protein n=1 Tax=Thalassotalea eurytherma TaxID=1144278 RepID=A0ABQ6H851_9GAMM|nr:hypothetical protein [Thalassotalea eurytherma]GLX83694.1 hypothetical protein theurythT_31470 [Thalassotalea eurytherma]